MKGLEQRDPRLSVISERIIGAVVARIILLTPAAPAQVVSAINAKLRRIVATLLHDHPSGRRIGTRCGRIYSTSREDIRLKNGRLGCSKLRSFFQTHMARCSQSLGSRFIHIVREFYLPSVVQGLDRSSATRDEVTSVSLG